jgi:hypothetical protein
MSEKLYDIEHPGYCSESNYYKDGTMSRFKCWADFLEEYKSFDNGQTLLFRWDWHRPEDDDGQVKPFSHDQYYRESELWLHWIGQSKGAYFCSIVDVCVMDEPVIREFLSQRWSHLSSLWAPFNERMKAGLA